MRDLKAIRDSFAKTLRTALHRRIPYPEEKDSKDSKPPREETKTLRRDGSDRDRTRTMTPRPAATAVPKQSNA